LLNVGQKLAARLGDTPASYDPASRYQVQLNRPVPAIASEPNGHMLRPGDIVEVNGVFANSIADAIIMAKLLPPQVD
jgi:hypothetical protein